MQSFHHHKWLGWNGNGLRELAGIMVVVAAVDGHVLPHGRDIAHFLMQLVPFGIEVRIFLPFGMATLPLMHVIAA